MSDKKTNQQVSDSSKTVPITNQANNSANQMLAPGSLYSMKPPVIDPRSMAESFYGKKV